MQREPSPSPVEIEDAPVETENAPDETENPPVETENAPDEPENPPPFETERQRRRRKISWIVISVVVALVLCMVIAGLAVGLIWRYNYEANDGEKVGEENSSKERRALIPPKREAILECSLDPPLIHGLNLAWDGISRTVGTNVTYYCMNSTDDDYIVAVCDEKSREWQMISRSGQSCTIDDAVDGCREYPPDLNPEQLTDWDGHSHSTGLEVNYRCTNAPERKIFKVQTCLSTGVWETTNVLENNCTFCSLPKHFGYPLQSNATNSSNRMLPGESVAYWCPHPSDLPKVFLVIKCMLDGNWEVQETHECLYLVDRKLNFSSAEEACEHNDAHLVVVHDTNEQDQLAKLLSNSSQIGNTCNHAAFIGLREDLNRQWLTSDGNFVSALSRIWGKITGDINKRCAILKPPTYQLVNVPCTAEKYCFVCRFLNTSIVPNSINRDRCSGLTCITVETKKMDFQTASDYCRSGKGKLFPVRNYKDLRSVRNAVNLEFGAKLSCSGFLVGLQAGLYRFYETLFGPAPAISFFWEQGSNNLDNHCVTSHQFHEFNWMDENCSKANCFVCKINGKDVKMKSPFSLIRYGESNDKSNASASKKFKSGERKKLEENKIDPFAKPELGEELCLKGWVSGGAHCFYFNTTLTTHEEAHQACIHHKGMLASLTGAYERSFIIDRLMSAYSNKSANWHIEATVGLPLRQIGEKVNGTAADKCIVLHLQPKLSWSHVSCNFKASFVCHHR